VKSKLGYKDPICSPIGISDISTPRLNSVIPMIITKALIRKRIRFHDGTGAIVKFSSTTRMTIGIYRKG
jgi:hypothetical protein